MTYEVQQTRWDRIIRRVSASVGPGSRVSETISELMPVLDVERIPPELLLLGGTRTAFGGGTLTGAAGESAKAQLFNPAATNLIATITRVLVSSTAVTGVRWGFSAAAFAVAGIGTERYTDLRQGVVAQAVCQIRQLSEVALANAIGQGRILPNTVLDLRNEDGIAILAPDTGFEIGLDTLATSIFYTFYWRERTAEQSELQF